MPQFVVDRRHFLALTGGAVATSLVTPRLASSQEPLVLVTTIDSDPPTLNSAISSDIQGGIASSPVYSSLLRLDADGNPEPDLAVEWTVSEDGRVFTFHLREGVLFHDGEPFTSADVKWTIENMLAPTRPIGMGAYITLESIEAPDDHTVVITFSRPNILFLSNAYALGPILPMHLWDGTDFTQNPLDKQPVGTGPYRLVEYRIGEAFRYVRNEDYFIEGQPVFDELVMRIIPDAVSRSAAFENGELDTVLGNSIPYTDIARFQTMPNVGMQTTHYTGAAWMGLINLRNEPYSNKDVRKAIAHAIDRTFIRDTVLPGISSNMVGPIWPTSPLYNDTLADYAFDPARANELLDEAGFPRGADGNRFDFRLMWQTNFAAVGRMADIIAQNLRDVGIRAVLMPLETAAVIQRGYIDGEFDLLIGSYALGPDPDYGTERLYNSNNIRPAPYTNNSHYANEEVDELFEQQRLATTFEERKALYDRIQEVIWDELPTLPICAYDVVAFYNEDFVQGDIYTKYNVFAEDFARAVPASR